MDKKIKIIFTFIFLIIFLASYAFYELLKENKKTVENNFEILSKKIADSNIARADNDWNIKYESEQAKLELKQEISRLKNQLISLEDELKKLDETTYKVELNKIKPNVKWMNIENWRKIRTGLTEQEVIQILGTPTRRNAYSGNSVVLIYQGYGKSGSVTVNPYLLGVQTWSEPKN